VSLLTVIYNENVPYSEYTFLWYVFNMLCVSWGPFFK